MNRLVCVIMGEDHRHMLEICLKSVQGADKVIYADGGSTDGTVEMLEEHGFKRRTQDCGYPEADLKNREFASSNCQIIEKYFDQEDPLANPNQRNFYLDYLKEHHSGDWILCLDADEVLSDNGINKLRELMKQDKVRVFDLKMRHLVYSFRHEDFTKETHYVPRRFFKVTPDLHYPLGEHMPLSGDFTEVGGYSGLTVWHLAYAPMLHVLGRYRKNLKHSAVHSPEFLKQWYQSHLFGRYPVRELNPNDLPKVLLEGYGVDPEELYFQGRGLENKHWIDAVHWRDHFVLKGRKALEFGCGTGPRVYAMKNVGIDATGIELSKWAVAHTLAPGKVFFGDVTQTFRSIEQYDLVLAYDLLEHVPYEKLDNAISNLVRFSKKWVLVSVPVKGDPNLEADPTHIIKETKEWWKAQFTERGLTEHPVPDYFQYKEQLMIFEVP